MEMATALRRFAITPNNGFHFENIWLGLRLFATNLFGAFDGFLVSPANPHEAISCIQEVSTWRWNVDSELAHRFAQLPPSGYHNRKLTTNANQSEPI